MRIEPEPNPDGSCHCWHYHKQDTLVAILERMSQRQWKVYDHARWYTFSTRKAAVDFIHLIRVT